MIFMRSLSLMENRETSRKIWSLRVGPIYGWDKAPQKEMKRTVPAFCENFMTGEIYSSFWVSVLK